MRGHARIQRRSLSLGAAVAYESEALDAPRLMVPLAAGVGCGPGPSKAAGTDQALQMPQAGTLVLHRERVQLQDGTMLDAERGMLFVPLERGSHGALREAMQRSPEFYAALPRSVQQGNTVGFPARVELPPVDWVVP